MNTGWLKARQTKYTGFVAVYIVVILAILGAVNFLANRYDKSWDSTANKSYSLSDQTVKVAKGLNRDVTIVDFDDTQRFPTDRDLLERYKELSPKIHTEYIDPVKKPQQARAAGFTRDATLLVDSGLRKEPAKALTEEEVTGAMIRSLKSGERNVCFVRGSGERSLDDNEQDGYGSVKDALEKNNYKTRTISLLGAGAAAQPDATADKAGAAAATAGKDGQPAPGAAAAAKPGVPQDCTILVVAGPRYAYTQPEVDAIKTYVEGGGHALLMLDPALNLGKNSAAENAPLDALIESWGVTPNNNLALDTSGIGQIFNLGPEVPLVTSYEPHAIVRDLKDVATAFPLSRTLEFKSTDKAKVEKLFDTGENSYATSNISGGRITINPAKDKKGPLTLAVAGTYQGATTGRFVVVGSSMWADNSFIRFNGNRDLLLNMMNWLSSDEDLISIRPKEPGNHPLNLIGQRVNMMFWLSVVIFPLSVVSFGLATWWKRR
jgi:ABC-type uncharacterized transport system involved in gliding motility auxiliary subunit